MDIIYIYMVRYGTLLYDLYQESKIIEVNPSKWFDDSTGIPTRQQVHGVGDLQRMLHLQVRV